MRKVTRRVLTGLAFAASLFATAALAGALAASEGDPASAAATCRKAEVNPVTGHVLCIDPLGAPVEAPPASTELRADPMRIGGRRLDLGAELQVLYGVAWGPLSPPTRSE